MNRFKSALVVEDQKTTAMVISEVLKRLGIAEVDTARDGTEALPMLADRSYDLVVSDLHMEGMSGLELLRHVRSDHRYRTVPFIMISIDAGEHELARAREAGADAFLAKPFGAPALRRKLDLLWDMRDTLDGAGVA